MIDKQLLDRFLKSECTADERRQVLAYLESHPKALEDLLPETEFAEAIPGPWEPERSEQAFQEIRGRQNRPVKPLFRWSLAAAASILVVAVAIKLLTTGARQPAQQVAEKNKNIDAWVTQINSTPLVAAFQLPDGSSAELSPGSRIKYRKTFVTDVYRRVQLEGEAQFKVVGDQHRPFEVQSAELTTTVLGTWFSVLADPAARQIKVHLYNGRVQVAGRWKTKDSILILRPGDELVYNKESMLAVIKTPWPNKRDHVAYTTSRRTKLAASTKPEWYMFGGQPLTAVFDQLSDYYGVQINYFPSDIKDRYFTGKFSKEDSLEVILQDIALLHGLTLTKTDGIYIFRKKEH
jgi:ferric-dicitrate binding protein FerR (iron transport regulator)